MIRYRHLAPVALAGLGLVALLLATLPSARAAFPGRNGAIAYDSGSGRHSCSPYISAFRSHRVPVLDLACEAEDPSYSPSGRRILYTGRESGYGRLKLLVMNSDGSEQRQVPLPIGMNPRFPSFGTSGRILFADFHAGDVERSELWIVRPDGTGLRQLTRTPNRAERWSAWAANGRYIVVGARHRVYTLRPDGSRMKFLVHGDQPSTSPNSHLVVFRRRGPTGPHPQAATDLWLVHPDGKDPHRIYRSPGPSSPRLAHSTIYAPAFSPDGRWIAFALQFEVKKGGRTILCKIRPNGQDFSKIVYAQGPGGIASVLEPDWQPVLK